MIVGTSSLGTSARWSTSGVRGAPVAGAGMGGSLAGAGSFPSACGSDIKNSDGFSPAPPGDAFHRRHVPVPSLGAAGPRARGLDRASPQKCNRGKLCSSER
jgi:hypothetical protein